MDFGGFIILGLLGLFNFCWLFFTLISFDMRHPRRMARLAVLGVSMPLLVLSSIFIYKTNYLDEGLVSATMNGDAEEVSYLLSHGADPNAQWEDGKTALEIAKASKQQKIVMLLERAGAHE